MVNTLILLLTCLVIAALDRNRLVLSLILVILVVLTKEYGVILSLVWGRHAYRLGYRRFALLGALAPPAALLALFLAMPSARSIGFEGWRSLLEATFGYHLSLLSFRGANDYLKILYMWLWSMLWPVLLISALTVARGVKKRSALKRGSDRFSYRARGHSSAAAGRLGARFFIDCSFRLHCGDGPPPRKRASIRAAVSRGGRGDCAGPPGPRPDIAAATIVHLDGRHLNRRVNGHRAQDHQGAGRDCRAALRLALL